jgi:GT2 family glycosyltransferase
VLNGTDYGRLELIIVDNGSVEPETKALFRRLKQDKRVRILAAPGPFNFSALNNLAVAKAKGEIIVLMNNDITMTGSDWLAEMVSHAVRPNVGAVGCKLLYPDGTVQHAGVALGAGGNPGVAAHFGVGRPADDTGYFGHLAMTRNVSAVTAACLALRKSVFEQVGGLDEEALKVAFNDVDLCLKIREAGYDIVWTPFAVLVHHESASRGSDQEAAAQKRFNGEIRAMRQRWGKRLDADPFYGPNLERLQATFGLAIPPKRLHPWQVRSKARRKTAAAP